LAVNFKGTKAHDLITQPFHIVNIDEFVKSAQFVMPDWVRYPEHIEITGFRLSPE